MPSNVTRWVISALGAMGLVTTQPVLSADTIRLKSQDEHHSGKAEQTKDKQKPKSKHKEHDNRGRHLGSQVDSRKPKPERRPAQNESRGGGRLIDREPEREQSNPVPEPGTLSLLAMGIGAAALRAWRGRRQNESPPRDH